MDYWRFVLYNIVGGIMWILIVGFGESYFGNIPVVQRIFTLVISSIIVVSVLPAIIEAARQINQSPTA
jgi:membrane-associated protein